MRVCELVPACVKLGQRAVDGACFGAPFDYPSHWLVETSG